MVRCVAIVELVKNWKNGPNTFYIVKSCTRYDGDAPRKNSKFLRWISLFALATYWGDAPDTLDILYDRAINDPSQLSPVGPRTVRQLALEFLLAHYPTPPKTLELLRDRAANDPDEELRDWAQTQLNRIRSGE